jgi:hypothetical protein
MGKGTALKNSSDLDCILFMNNIPNVAYLMANLGNILAQITAYLRRQPFSQLNWSITIQKVNEYMVQFEMTSTTSNKTVKVDLLPTFDANVCECKSVIFRKQPRIQLS